MKYKKSGYQLLILILTLIISWLIYPSIKQSHASSVTQDMDDFYESLGGSGNFTRPQFIQGQKAGYLSLGGLQYRSSNKNMQLASIQLPSLRAGCGGIDFFEGGLSFIKSDQFQALIKKIGSNAPGLLIQMAIDQTTPQLGSVIKYMNNLAREINELNINSCDAAKALLQSPGTIMQTAKTHACKIGGMLTSKFSDAAAASAGCNAGGEATEIAKAAPQEIKDQFPTGDINIAWKALKDSGFISISNIEGRELAEMMMTLSGTIVIKDATNDDGKPSINPYFSLATDDNLIKALLEGGTYDSLSCNDYDECLEINKKTVSIEPKKSYLGRVSEALVKIQDAIKTDDPSKMDAGSYKLLSFSSLPLYKMINIQTAYYPNSTEISTIAEYIALDILYGYLEKENELIRRAAAKYDKEAYRKVFNSWFEEQKEIKIALNLKRQKLSAQFKDYYEILNRTATIEKMFSKDITNQVLGGR